MNTPIRNNPDELLYINSRFYSFKKYIYTFHINANPSNVIEQRILTNKPTAKLTEQQCQILCKLYYHKFLHNVINVDILQLSYDTIIIQLLIDLNWHHLLKYFTPDENHYREDNLVRQHLNYINQGQFRAHPMVNSRTGHLIGAVSRL